MGIDAAFDRNERAIVTITTLSHAVVHVFELSIPVFIPIWIEEFSTSPVEIGVVVAVGYALFGLGALPSGFLTDRYGCARPLLLGLIGMAGSFALLSVAPSLLVVGVALVLWGVAASVHHPAGLSLISTGVDRRGTALGYHGIAGNVGIALGPLVTLLCLLVFPWRTVALLLTIPAVLSIVVVATVNVNESTAAGATDGGPVGGDEFSPRPFISNTRTLFTAGFTLVFALYILEGLYYRGSLTFLPDLLGDFDAFSPITVGAETVDPTEYIYAALLLVGVFGQYAGGWLSDRIRPERGAMTAFAGLVVISLVFIPAANAGIVPLLVVSALLGLFLFGLQPFMQSSVAEHTPAAARGRSFGIVFAGLFGIGAAGASVTGVVLTWAGPAELFVLLAGYVALATVIAWRLVGVGRPSA